MNLGEYSQPIILPVAGNCYGYLWVFRKVAWCWRNNLVLGNFNTVMSLWDFHVSPSGEVISSVSKLQSLKVEPSAEKEKLRSEAKHILMQKQRALADLFKYLANMGKVLS